MNRKLTINSEDFFLSFNDNEYNCLKQYYAEYIKLKESTLIKENKIVNNLKISATVGEKINIVNPNEDYFAIFLHKLRPFILQNEPYSFHKISSLVNKKIESKIFRNEVNLVRKNFNNPESQIPIKLEIDNIQYNTNEFLYLYLNSFEYHRDQDKKDKIENIFPINSIPLLKNQLTLILLKKWVYIQKLGIITYAILNEESLAIKIY